VFKHARLVHSISLDALSFRGTYATDPYRPGLPKTKSF
jgi:hypothetical protein